MAATFTTDSRVWKTEVFMTMPDAEQYGKESGLPYHVEDIYDSEMGWRWIVILFHKEV